MGNYYNQIIKENALSQNEKISLFILSFKNKINLTNSESLEELATFFKIDFDIFLDSLNNLHDKELCDVFQDKAAKVSDQSLSDFITIDFIVNSRIFKIRDFFINLFPKYKKEILKMLVLVNNFVTLKSWTNYLENEIKFIYNEVIEHFNKELFLEQYAVLIPIEALSYINQKIKDAESTEYQITQKEFEEKKGTNRVNDPIIKILCSLSNSERFNDAGIFLMKYFKKRQDKVYEVFSAIESKFDIDEDWKFYLEKRFCIFEIFSKQKNISELTALLIVNIAEKFLKFSGEKLIANGRSVVINRYTLVDGDYLSELHKKIFDTLFEVYNLDYVEVNNYIDKLLFNYPTYEVSNGFFKTVTSDLKCLETLFFKDLGKLDIRKEAIVFNLYSETKKLKLKPQPFLGYKLSITQSIYNTFSSNMLTYDDSNFNYEEFQVLRLKKLNKVYEEYSDSLPWLFNTLSKYQSDELLDKYELQESIFMLYTHSKVDEKIKILIALLNSEFSIQNYHYDCFMEKLSFKNGKKVLNSVKNEVKESWYLSNLITSKNIDKDMLEELILLLRKLKNYEILNCFSILSFESYIQLDTNILDILVSKYRDGEILESFFLPNYVSEEQANKIVAIVGHKELEEIYYKSIASSKINYYEYDRVGYLQSLRTV